MLNAAIDFRHNRNGTPLGQQNHPDWPWELMYEDLLWSLEKLSDRNAPSRDRRIAATIFQAWMGQAENMSVRVLEIASSQPIEGKYLPTPELFLILM